MSYHANPTVLPRTFRLKTSTGDIFQVQCRLSTGLVDKNGVEIFEGDLVNYKVKGITHLFDGDEVTNAEVYWSQEDASFIFGKFKMDRSIDGEGQYWGYMMMDGINKDTLEVVGRI